MTNRYDAVIVRTDKDGKKRYTKIGAMFPSRNGDGFNCVLDALPMPNAEGQAWISFFVPKDRDDARPISERAAPRGPASGSLPHSDIDDSIPFAPEWR